MSKGPPKFKDKRYPVMCKSGRNSYRETLEGFKYGGLSFDKIRERMDEIEEKYGDQFDHFVLEVDLYYDYGDLYPAVYLWGVRDESDEEYKERMAKDEKNKKDFEERQREQYEALREIFGDD
jgi:hypothetical protein